MPFAVLQKKVGAAHGGATQGCARQVKGVAANFLLVVQDLLQFAPEAALNLGAQEIRENSTKPFIYPSKTAFYEEIVWMLWQMSLNSNPT